MQGGRQILLVLIPALALFVAKQANQPIPEEPESPIEREVQPSNDEVRRLRDMLYASQQRERLLSRRLVECMQRDHVLSERLAVCIATERRCADDSSKAQLEREHPDSFKLIDNLFRGLPVGNVALSAPREMYVGDKRDVVLQASLSESIQSLKARMERRSPRSPHGGQVFATPARVDSLMRASLTGSSGLAITALDSIDEKPLPGTGFQEWSWEIEAKAAGAQQLYLTISALAVLRGKERPIPIETLSQVIEVRVSRKRAVAQFIANNWQWILATLITPFTLALWEFLKRTRNKRQDSLIIRP